LNNHFIGLAFRRTCRGLTAMIPVSLPTTFCRRRTPTRIGYVGDLLPPRKIGATQARFFIRLLRGEWLTGVRNFLSEIPHDVSIKP
jgi:hypothetical protein